MKSFLCLYICLCLSLAGCAVGPDFVRPEPPQVEHYTNGAEPAETIPAGGQAQHFEQGAKIAADWWRFFNSSGIETVIKDAIVNNPTLQAAQASLLQSQDNLRAGYGVFLPQVDAGFDASRQKSSLARFGGSPKSSIFNLYTLQATVSYTLDVFGGEHRTVESLEAQADFQRYAFLGTYLALSGNIVNTIIARAAYREQVKATDQVIGFEKEQVGITETQAQAGTVPYSNVLSLRSQLAASESTLPPLRQKLSQADHLLATLTGHLPAEGTLPQIDLADITLPGNLPLSLPSDLVRQRPDVLAAEAQLHSASANIGVATAAMFPDFTLSGAYGWSNNSLGNLVKNSSGIWNLGGGVVTPIFHGGTLWFRREAAIEAYNQSLANYRQTVLSAFEQVADTLRALENDADAVKSQSEALSTAEETMRLLQANYQSGTVGYLQMLIADAQYSQAKIGYLQALAQRLQDTVALFVALGGGWWNDGDLTKR